MSRPLSPSRSLVRLLEVAATPLVAFDAARRIVFANRALGEWLGLDPERLIGLRSDYGGSQDDPLAAAASALGPPPEAFAGQVQDGAASRLASPERPFERRAVRYWRLAGATPEASLLLAAIWPAEAGAAPSSAATFAPAALHARLLELRSRARERYAIAGLIGDSEPLRQVREQVRIAAATHARTVVLGPRGSGREHVARTIHSAAPAGDAGPLVPVACELVDAEHLQVALAAALRRAEPGRPPTALLLDVDRLREGAQLELFGFLQLPQIELRTLATSRRGPVALAQRGKFHRELAYLLSAVVVRLPPLAARREDLPLLAQHFLEQENAGGGRQLSGVQPAALELLLALPWPDNLDGLARAVRESCQRAAGPLVAVADLPEWVHLAQHGAQHAPRSGQRIELDAFLGEVEKELLARALRQARGNKSRAAEQLGLTRQRLLRKLVQHGLAAPPAAEEPVVFEPLPDDAE